MVNEMKSKLAKLGGIFAGVVVMALPFVTHAAADADLVAGTDSLASNVKVNIFGAIFSATMLTVMGALLAAFLIWRVVIRFTHRVAK